MKVQVGGRLGRLLVSCHVQRDLQAVFKEQRPLWFRVGFTGFGVFVAQCTRTDFVTRLTLGFLFSPRLHSGPPKRGDSLKRFANRRANFPRRRFTLQLLRYFLEPDSVLLSLLSHTRRERDRRGERNSRHRRKVLRERVEGHCKSPSGSRIPVQMRPKGKYLGEMMDVERNSKKLGGGERELNSDHTCVICFPWICSPGKTKQARAPTL